jgi:hypothetical protein
LKKKKKHGVDQKLVSMTAPCRDAPIDTPVEALPNREDTVLVESCTVSTYIP